MGGDPSLINAKLQGDGVTSANDDTVWTTAFDGSLRLTLHEGSAFEVLDGAKGARRDVVLLNAAAALRAAGLAGDWKEGLGLAAEAIDAGRAGDVLQRWAGISQE